MIELIEFVDSAEHFNDLDEAFKMLPSEVKNQTGDKLENQRLTFKDLQRLRNILPEQKKTC